MNQKYAVVDIEATGGTQKVDRIIEIGIVLIDGDQITESYSTLINPGISIPPFITKLTGISHQMVANKPQFHEVAKTIVEMTEGRSLVAHNVSFDYRILREEFDRLGYEFKSDTLCTARLSRHYFPDFEKYNLKSVARALDLTLKDSHRAGDDAMAAAEIMLKILEKSRSEGLSLKNMSIYKRQSTLPTHMSEEQILDLPNVCGVYYMLDEDDEPIYIGKSIKVRSRIRAHFTEKSNKTAKMQKLVHKIIYEKTGSELMAEVHESLEIRKHKPLLNRAKRKSKFHMALLVDEVDGYQTFQIKYKTKVKDKSEVLQWFSSKNAAKAYLSSIVQLHNLCGCLCGMTTTSQDCVTVKIGDCDGAYLGHEKNDSYNERFADAIHSASRLYHHDMLVLDIGREDNEYAAFLISENTVSHVGYLKKSDAHKDIEKVKKRLNKIDAIPEIDRLVYRFYYEGRTVKKIDYPAESLAQK